MAVVANAASVFDDVYNSGGAGSYYAPLDVLHTVNRSGNKFQELVNNRCEYLDSLKTIGAGWISGVNSVAPENHVIEQAKSILIDFASWLESTKLNAPRLVMGPMPAGGISIEFVIDGKFKVYLHLYNNHTSEMTIENIKEGLFSDIDTIGNSIEYLLKKVFIYFQL